MKISCCGLDCETCDAYIATINNDDVKRAEIAEKWAELYKHAFKALDINCTGCHSDGVKIGHCSFCEVRKCCYDRGIKNCAPCEDFACKDLEAIFSFAPDARKRLEGLN